MRIFNHRKFYSDDFLVCRILIGILWVFVLAALAGSFALPPTIDIYIFDVFIPIAKARLILAIFLLFVFPLLIFTMRRTKQR